MKLSTCKKKASDWRRRLTKTIKGLSLLLLSWQVNAQLPTPVDPSTGDPDGNYLEFMEGWTGDATEYIALAISGGGIFMGRLDTAFQV